MDQTQPFYVGLCMAGAVSAGAYTAGVMDYLIEALEDWESKRNQPGIPTHRVIIPVIGGASAGGMTGIITASGIHNSIPPVTKIGQTNLFEQQPQNMFYHSWVDLLADDMFSLMLDTSDIEKGTILSLLNSSFIPRIAQRALQVNTAARVCRPYIEENLKVFTTLSSLRGLSFDIAFRSGSPSADHYFVTKHNDYACFKLNTTTYSGDGWIPLDFQSGLSLPTAIDAAMATGAFPVGLQARTLKRASQYINDNPWLEPIAGIKPVTTNDFETLVVDGGVINNEPFEKVRDVLISVTGQTNPGDYHSYDAFTSTVLMIDPFPSLPPVYNPSDHLFAVVGSTLGTLLDQVRIKPAALVDAMDSKQAGQFLIAPSRDVPQLNGGTKTEIGSKAIACGALDGFSGFFHKEFRIHDYFLGRANCEKFLRDHFTVPAGSRNSINAGYASLSEGEKQRFYSSTDSGPTLPIIPVLTPRSADKYLPVFSSGTDWPVRNDEDIERFRSKTKDRVQALIMNMAEYNALTTVLLKIGGWVILNRKLAGAFLDAVKKSLNEQQLLRL